MAGTKKEVAAFTKRNILAEINKETDPVKKAALRKERQAKLNTMKQAGDTRADKWAGDKEKAPSAMAASKANVAHNKQTIAGIKQKLAKPSAKIPAAKKESGYNVRVGKQSIAEWSRGGKSKK